MAWLLYLVPILPLVASEFYLPSIVSDSGSTKVPNTTARVKSANEPVRVSVLNASVVML
jgi:hypothetical protein